MHRVPLEQTCLRVKVLGYPGSLAQVLANVIEACVARQMMRSHLSMAE
jgi:hypothetical protein